MIGGKIAGPTLKSPIVFQCQDKYTLTAKESRITMFLS